MRFYNLLDGAAGVERLWHRGRWIGADGVVMVARAGDCDCDCDCECDGVLAGRK